MCCFSAPFPSQTSSGQEEAWLEYPSKIHTQTNRVGVGTAHRPCCSMRVQFSEAIGDLGQSLVLSTYESQEKTPNDCCFVQQHQGCLSPGLWAYTLLVCRQTRLQAHSKLGWSCVGGLGGTLATLWQAQGKENIRMIWSVLKQRELELWTRTRAFHWNCVEGNVVKSKLPCTSFTSIIKSICVGKMSTIYLPKCNDSAI